MYVGALIAQKGGTTNATLAINLAVAGAAFPEAALAGTHAWPGPAATRIVDQSRHCRCGDFHPTQLHHPLGLSQVLTRLLVNDRRGSESLYYPCEDPVWPAKPYALSVRSVWMRNAC